MPHDPIRVLGVALLPTPDSRIWQGYGRGYHVLLERMTSVDLTASDWWEVRVISCDLVLIRACGERPQRAIERLTDKVRAAARVVPALLEGV